MAGHPIRTAQELYLTNKEIEVFEYRAEGHSWREVAKQFNTSTHVLNCWLKSDPVRLAAWKALDSVAAESRASDAKEILDDAMAEAKMGISSPEITRLAISRSELAKWEAGVMARGRFGAPSAGNVTQINIGEMHLTAVRDLNKNPPPPPKGLIPDAEFEVIEEPVDLAALLGGTVEPTLEDLLGG